MDGLSGYLPQDRLRAIARGETLPDRTTGAAVFADISGFTPLTEALRDALGPRRGAEELTRHLDAVYTALISEVEKYGGSVLGFAGDAITCWFDQTGAEGQGLGDASQRAVNCAFGLQHAMDSFKAIALPNGTTTALTLKVAVATGEARRFVVGDPAIHYLDALAGATVARTATGERLAQTGEVLVDAATVLALGDSLTVKEWRAAHEGGERFAVVAQSSQDGGRGTGNFNPQPPTPEVPVEHLLTWLHKAQVEREHSFLTEFRPCVVLFVRFMGIDYDADDAQTHLDVFIRQLQDIASRYEGAILQLIIGDKGSYLYLNFGALSSHEDDARRAVKTALELKRTARLQLQMGLMQGVMRVGAYGGATRRTYGALGDEVNLAARLMSNAAVGEILLGGQIQKTTANDFVSEPRPPLPLKGKAEPLPVFAVTGERQHRAIRLQEPTYALPMVGRHVELQTINDKLELTLQGKSQIVGIVAEAGLGKSRLVAEAIRAAHKKGFIGYGGACQSDAINTPYQTWKSIWAAFFDVDPSAPLRKQLRSLEGEIEDRAPERVQALPLLGILLSLEIPDNDFTKTLEPQYRQSALRALLEDCLRAAAKDEPLLIVIEDLHWIDALSLDLTEELAHALSDSRVCFVLAYRLSLASAARREAAWIASLPNFTKIELHELNAAEAEGAIRAKLAQLYPARSGAVPPRLVEKLMARAQGNPFYLEELLNFLHDRSLDPRNPADLNKIELPDSLHTLILSRIDQVSEREKTTLRVASIIGRSFRADWLTGYYPDLGNATQVQADLEQLADMDIMSQASPELERMYLFKHIVTHEVTYESLPFATRAKLHEQLAAYLERQIAVGALRIAPVLDTLVYHYERSDNYAKQREYLRKAAEAAQAVSAFNTAAEYLARLLALTPATPSAARSALALQLAEAHYRLGDFPAARAVIGQAQAAATTDADRASALALLGEITTDGLGDYAAAQTILAEAVPLARTSGHALTLCHALSALGWLYCLLGKLDDATLALEESLALARVLGDMTRELFALTRLGAVKKLQANLAEAERLWREVHRRAVAEGNRERAMVALNSLGVVASERQDYMVQREYIQQALALAREIGAQQNIALYLVGLADNDIKLGQYTAARTKLREALTLARRLGALSQMVWAVENFAELAHAEGQTERAVALFGLARRHPAWSSANQDALDAVLAQWALDPSVVEAGLTKGAALAWDETIQELLKG